MSIKANKKDIKSLRKKLKKLRKPINRQRADFIGKKTVNTIKQMTADGISPVRATGIRRRYKAYSKSYKDAINNKVAFFIKNDTVIPIKAQKPRRKKRGKGKTKGVEVNNRQYKGKTIRPVNLRLSGDMMNALTYRVVRDRVLGFVAEIFFKRGTLRDRSNFHNEGTDKMPRRPILPDASAGEKFNATLQKDLTLLVRNRLRVILKE